MFFLFLCVCLCVCVFLFCRDVLIKQLEQDLVTAVQKVKTQKEEHTKKLVGFRNEVRFFFFSFFVYKLVCVIGSRFLSTACDGKPR